MDPQPALVAGRTVMAPALTNSPVRPTWTRERQPLQEWGSGVGPPPRWFGPPIPAEHLPDTLLRTYEGTADTIRQLREMDQRPLAKRGYSPTAETWIPQRRGLVSWVIAIALIVVLVGLVVIVYYFANPTGALTVTYKRQSAADGRPAEQDIREALRQAQQLHAEGLITNSEYEGKRAELLARL